MKTTLVSALILIVSALSLAQADTLPRGRQIEIIENYMYVTGQTAQPSPQALEAAWSHPDRPPFKCGTPVLVDFILNRDKLDPVLLKALGAEFADRPTYTDEHTYDSPAGHFKIHYTTVGLDAVYRPGHDRDGDGVPDYVEDMALILDSVWVHIIDTLGFPPPPADSFYPSGGDDKYDIYISNLFGAVFGQTYFDSLSIDGPGSIRATSFIELENDYQEDVFSTYRNRPLDAVRVTCAHEFFHAVQFGIDFTEAEPVTPLLSRRYWMEMSAVWMEEEIYDDINDYYYYLPAFFCNPRLSIQQFNSTGDYHPYASVVLPIFLSEKFGRGIIRDIWLRCGELGSGPSFLIAAQLAIDSISGGAENWPSAFRDFALWNFFTGDRAWDAPEGIGYSEKKMYPAIYDTAIVENTEYPTLVLGNDNPRRPEHNSAAYVRLNHMRAIVVNDTTFWNCDSGSFSDSSCVDSTLVTDTTTGYEIMHIDDSVYSVYIGLGDGHPDHLIPPQPWGLNIVFRLDSIPDSFIVDQFFLPYQEPSNPNYTLLKILDPNQYRSVTMIISPASYRRGAYETPPYDYSLGYYIPERLDSTRIDTPIFIDSQFVDIPAAVLAPYPNPAVVSNMGEAPLRFKFQIPTDLYGNFIYYTDHNFSVDIFNVAGEFVRRLDTTVTPDRHDKQVEFVMAWDMKNERREEVASGVYIALGRVYCPDKGGLLLAEDKAKVAIVR